MDSATILAYNQLANNYEAETNDFWERFPRVFIDKFSSLASGKIVDIGCGPGRDGLILQAKGLDVTCLDASETMVALCEKKGLKAVLGDLVALPFENGAFDAVWAYTSLLHVTKSEADHALEEIKRILKARGLLGLGLIEGEIEGYRESSKVQMPRWFSYYTKHEIEDMLERHGFVIKFFTQFKPDLKNYLNFIAEKR